MYGISWENMLSDLGSERVNVNKAPSNKNLIISTVPRRFGSEFELWLGLLYRVLAQERTSLPPPPPPQQKYKMGTAELSGNHD